MDTPWSSLHSTLGPASLLITRRSRCPASFTTCTGMGETRRVRAPRLRVLTLWNWACVGKAATPGSLGPARRTVPDRVAGGGGEGPDVRCS